MNHITMGMLCMVLQMNKLQELLDHEETVTKQEERDDFFLTDIVKGFGAGAVDTIESAALGAATAAEEENESAIRDTIQSIAKSIRPDVDPDSTWGKVAGGLGSAAAFIAPAVAAAFAITAAPIVAALSQLLLMLQSFAIVANMANVPNVA